MIIVIERFVMYKKVSENSLVSASKKKGGPSIKKAELLPVMAKHFLWHQNRDIVERYMKHKGYTKERALHAMSVPLMEWLDACSIKQAVVPPVTLTHVQSQCPFTVKGLDRLYNHYMKPSTADDVSSRSIFLDECPNMKDLFSSKERRWIQEMEELMTEQFGSGVLRFSLVPAFGKDRSGFYIKTPTPHLHLDYLYFNDRKEINSALKEGIIESHSSGGKRKLLHVATCYTTLAKMSERDHANNPMLGTAYVCHDHPMPIPLFKTGDKKMNSELLEMYESMRRLNTESVEASVRVNEEKGACSIVPTKIGDTVIVPAHTLHRGPVIPKGLRGKRYVLVLALVKDVEA